MVISSPEVVTNLKAQNPDALFDYYVVIQSGQRLVRAGNHRFLGFVVYPHRRRLKRRKGIAFRRRLQALAEAYADGAVTLDQITASVRGWVNHARYGNTVGLRKAVLRSVRLK